MLRLDRLARSVRWYSRGLVDVFTVALTALILAGVYYAVMQKDRYSAVLWLWFTLDAMLYPLYTLLTIMHITREDSVTVFELNLLGGFDAVYLGRLLLAVVAQVPVLAAAYALCGRLGIPLAPFAAKLAYTIIVAVVAMLLASRRVAFIAVASLTMLLPFTAPFFIGRVEALHEKLDYGTAALMVASSPFYAWFKRNVLPVPYDSIVLTIAAFAALAALAGFYAFSSKEFSV